MRRPPPPAGALPGRPVPALRHGRRGYRAGDHRAAQRHGRPGTHLPARHGAHPQHPSRYPGSGCHGRAAAAPAAYAWTSGSMPPPARRLRGVVRSSKKPRNRVVKTTRSPYDVPLDPRSPWPKFRRNAPRRTGRSPDAAAGRRRHACGRSRPARGSSARPVVDGDGNVYIGSADRTFYALARRRHGALAAAHRRDHRLRRRCSTTAAASTSAPATASSARSTPRPATAVWTFAADPPAVNGAFINWFEGNVAIGADGTLYVPNDNFFIYAHRPRHGAGALDASRPPTRRGRCPPSTPRPAGSSSATTTCSAARHEHVRPRRRHRRAGVEARQSTAPSPRARCSRADGTRDRRRLRRLRARLRPGDRRRRCWAVRRARPHLREPGASCPTARSCSRRPTARVYALDPATGALRWQFDTREPIRSSPAVDGDGNVYVGSGEGRLFVLNPDGTLRWSMQLIDGPRNDLNASPALGPDADRTSPARAARSSASRTTTACGPTRRRDARCQRRPGEDLPDDGAVALWTTQFGAPLATPPAEIEAEPAAHLLALRARRPATRSSRSSTPPASQVTLDPPVPIRTEVSGDRKFLTIIPQARLAGPRRRPAAR